jgi:hypothetical protein
MTEQATQSTDETATTSGMRMLSEMSDEDFADDIIM